MVATTSHHATLVRGLHFGLNVLPPGSARMTSPTILQRSEQNFIPAILEEIAAFNTTGRTALANTVAATRTSAHVLKLFQPMQRTFHVALLDLACDRSGTPRLDPARIESAGLVLRRVWRDQRGVAHPDILEGWQQDGARVAGWVRFGSRAEANVDPDPAQRRGHTGNDYLDSKLALWRNVTARYEERTSAMFVAPPDTCKAAGRTVLYGVIPMASTERAEPPANSTVAAEQFPASEVRGHLSPLLRSTTATLSVPYAGHRMRVRAGDTTDLEAQDQRYAATAHDAAIRPWVSVNDTTSVFRTYTDMLKQLYLEFDVWGASPQSRALYAQLDRIVLEVRPAGRPSSVPPDKRSAAELLKLHYEVLVRRDRGVTVDMPDSWPIVPGIVISALVDGAKRALDARLAVAPQNAGRFDDINALYRIRAFVRVRDHEGCPTRIVWSDYTEPFIIAPWYDTTGAPPVPIPLPEVTSEFLRSVKPNVAFVIPPKLAGLIQSDAKKLMAGAISAPATGVKAMCSLSIPIITICAFILLAIMLSILDVVFRWMPFVKICVPVPNLSTSQSAQAGS